jgi:hypothetical protein
MPGKRRALFLVLAAGLILAVAGAAGLALTRHPVAADYAAAPTLPAPTGPIAAVPQQRSAQVSPPVTLTTPSIGVQTSLIRLGLAADGTLQVPQSTAVAGWYTGSPRPGAVGSAVIAGHIDSRTGLRPGDRVYVRRADGTLAVFRVTAVRQFPKDSFPTSAVYGPTPDPEVRLITCGGTFDPQLGSYLSNTIVYAAETS